MLRERFVAGAVLPRGTGLARWEAIEEAAALEECCGGSSCEGNMLESPSAKSELRRGSHGRKPTASPQFADFTRPSRAPSMQKPVQAEPCLPRRAFRVSAPLGQLLGGRFKSPPRCAGPCRAAVRRAALRRAALRREALRRSRHPEATVLRAIHEFGSFLPSDPQESCHGVHSPTSATAFDGSFCDLSDVDCALLVRMPREVNAGTTLEYVSKVLRAANRPRRRSRHRFVLDGSP